MSDLFQVPIVFVDGEQPTARKLNKWAEQLDSAFSSLERLLGIESDPDAPNYIVNLANVLGNIGWLDSRLPQNISLGLAEPHSPIIIEELDANGQKEAVLTFMPLEVAAPGGTIPDVTSIDLSGDGATEWDHVTSFNSFTDVNQYRLEKRFLQTSARIGEGATISYVVDPTTSYDSYSPTSGATVVPNLYQIALPGDLCTFETNEGVHTISFPRISRCMNPQYPFNLEDDKSLDLDPNGVGPVKWAGADSQPQFTIPESIYTAVDENGLVPSGLCSLWIRSSIDPFAVSRVEGADPLDPIQFFVDALRTQIQVEIPTDLALTMPHMVDGDLSTQYIVGFSGVSIAEALLHERARSIYHKHDGSDDGSLIDAAHISNRFNPAHYNRARNAHNHYPQYLLRTGFDDESDPLNDNNALMGDLLITRSDKVAGDGTDPTEDFLGLESFSLYLGSTAGPRLFFDGTDVAGYDASVGKLVIRDQAGIFPTRFLTPDLFLGAESTGLQLHWSAANDVLTLSDANESALTPGGIGLRFGTLIIADGKISFEDAETVDSLVPATMTFEMDDTIPTWTLAKGGEVWDPRTRLVVGEVYVDGIVNHNSNATLTKWIGPEGWTSVWAEGSGPPAHEGDGSPWVYRTGFGAETIGEMDFLTEAPPHLKGVGVDGGQITSSIKALRKVIDLDPLVSAAAIGPNSGLVLKNIKFVLSSGDNSGANNLNYYKAYVRRCRIFDAGSFVFDATTETIFTSPNIWVGSVGPGHFTISLLAADSSHEFNFKEYMYTIELVSIDDYDASDATDFDFYGCQLILTADYIG